MAICEDAPCCGCCGPNVWAAEAAAEAEYRYEDRDEYDDYYREADCELYPEDHGESSSGRAHLESTFLGFPFTVTDFECDGCGEVVSTSAHVSRPSWADRTNPVLRVPLLSLNRRAWRWAW